MCSVVQAKEMVVAVNIALRCTCEQASSLVAIEMLEEGSPATTALQGVPLGGRDNIPRPYCCAFICAACLRKVSSSY